VQAVSLSGLQTIRMAYRTLVCLANSRKGDGLCFAGLDPDTLEWVRPIGSGWHGAVLRDEQRYENRQLPKLLDVVEVPLGRSAAQLGQPENRRTANGQWRRLGRLTPTEAEDLLDEIVTSDPIFGNRGKAVHEDHFSQLDSSLAVVQPATVTWRKSGERLKSVFTHSGRQVDLSVTDPVTERAFMDDGDGDYEWRSDEQLYLSLSVAAAPSNGFHTKLVAGVIFLPS
jgi:hypothetical protein